MVRVGVVGVGGMGCRHVRVLSSLPGAALAGVFDLDRGRAEEVARQHGTIAFDDLEALLTNVDAAVIAVPTQNHSDVGRQAIRAGCSVLIEKPLALDLADAEALCEEAERAGVGLMVGYVERFNPAVVELKRNLKDEELLYLSFVRVGPEPPRTCCTGVILDLAIHDLDLLLHLSGRKVVRAAALAAGPGRHDTASLSFLLEDGILAHVTANWLTPFKVREIQAATPQQLYRCDLIRQELTGYCRLGAGGGYVVREIGVRVDEPLRAELAAFVTAVEAGSPMPVSGLEALKSLELARDCIASAELAATVEHPRCFGE